MAVEVTKTYKIKCDVCGAEVSKEHVRHVQIFTDEIMPGAGGDLCSQCMDLPFSELIRKLVRRPDPGDEQRIRDAMTEAQEHPGRVVTRA